MQPALSGSIALMSVADVIIFLGNRRGSGTLRVEREGTKKSVVVREGRVRSSSSDDHRERLGQFLLNLGHLTEDQFTLAYQTQQETKVPLGQILVMTGQLTEEVVRAALALKARETLLECFRWTSGRFTFDPGPSNESPEELELEVDLVDVHREGEHREEAWAAIRKLLPHGGLRLAVVEPRQRSESAGGFDARLLAAVQLGQSLDDLMLSLHATEFFLYQRVFQLLGEGALAIARGEGSLAGASVRRLSGDLCGHPLSRSAIPRLLVPAKTLYALEVPPSARYLLSRVNGERTIEAIVRASPLAEPEALSQFRELIEAGLVAVGEVAGAPPGQTRPTGTLTTPP